MAERNHPYLRPSRRHPTLIDDPGDVHRQSHGRAHPAAIIEAQERDIQALLHDNQRLATSHVALKRELAAADEEIRHLSSTASSIKAETNARVRELYEKSFRAEAELRSFGEQAAELAQVKTDIQNMTADRKEFSAKLREIEEELVVVRSELGQFSALEAEIETMQNEIQKGRAAIEYEKKMKAQNIEQSQIMGNHVVCMAREVEKLQEDLANAEKRAREAASVTPVAGYPGGYVYTEAGHSGPVYSDHFPMPQFQGSGGNPPYYAAQGLPHAPNLHG